ncbi:MAG TPA: PilZ domain-containing protein [Terracidiphilus sp.]|nr:PilZ domain-containing protein [Terracidiphilus sp.]
MFGLGDLKRRLKTLGYPEQQRAERLPAPTLAAHCDSELNHIDAGVKDISSTGLYLVTEKRFTTGEVVHLSLHAQGSGEGHKELEIAVDARVARQGQDGIGLSFVLPAGLDTNLWSVLVRNTVVLSQASEIAHMFRTLHAILLLCRLCQSGAEEAILLIGGQLDPGRTECVFEIMFAAEKLLASQPNADKLRADPKLIAHILREGSWAHSIQQKQLWIGLFANSCAPEGWNDANMTFADMLINITPVQAAIFIEGCSRLLASLQGSSSASTRRIVLSPREISELTGMYDATRLATDVAYLYNLGVIDRLFDFTSYVETENFDITPNSVGIDLFKRCRPGLSCEIVAHEQTGIGAFGA